MCMYREAIRRAHCARLCFLSLLVHLLKAALLFGHGACGWFECLSARLSIDQLVYLQD